MTDSPHPVALITGSGRNRVGNVVAEHLADRGYSIALHYRSSKTEAHESRDKLRDAGHKCEAYQADVSSPAEVETMISQAASDFGRIDALVTTASIWDEKPLEQITAEELENNFRINTLGTFYAARAAGLVMAAQEDGGSIVTVGDWAIDRPYLDFAAYFISKGSLPTLTRVLARELGHRNPKVRVNCIHPGPVMFPPDATEERKSRLVESTVVKNADCPESVAQAVAALLENQFITGACLPVDGGRHMFSPNDP